MSSSNVIVTNKTDLLFQWVLITSVIKWVNFAKWGQVQIFKTNILTVMLEIYTKCGQQFGSALFKGFINQTALCILQLLQNIYFKIIIIIWWHLSQFIHFYEFLIWHRPKQAWACHKFLYNTAFNMSQQEVSVFIYHFQNGLTHVLVYLEEDQTVWTLFCSWYLCNPVCTK